MRAPFSHIAIGLSFFCVLTAYATNGPSKKLEKDFPKAPGVSLLQSAAMSPEYLAKSMQPIGSLTGKWAGSWDGFIVTLEADVEPATLTFSPQALMTSKTVKRGFVTAEISRKGHILTIGEVSCLFQVDSREWNLRHNGCEAVESGSILELIKERSGDLTLRAKNAEILLRKG
jgi:hypothetical protein